jgi:CRP-like cAMP-binding protein
MELSVVLVCEVVSLMYTDRKVHKQIGNWILSALPRDVYEHLVSHLEYVDLPQGMTLYVPDDIIDYVYFPYSGMVSLVSITENGETVEVGMVGNEGMVGLPVILGEDKTPYQAEVQVSGDGMKLKADKIKAEFNQNDMLQSSPSLPYVTAFTVWRNASASGC